MELRSWRARVEAAREKCEQLEHFHAVIAPDFWKKVQETVKTEAATNQSLKLPVLFFLLDRRDIEDLQPLDRLLGYLRNSKEKRHRRELGKLASRLQEKTDYRSPTSALFEIDILIRLLEKNPESSVKLYPLIQNRNSPEASIRLGEKTVYLEATILSQTEDQERVWDIGHGKMNPSREEMENLKLHAVRRHPHVSTVAGVGDPCSNAHRFTRKIKDKQKQLAPQKPNILCIGLPDIDPNPSNLVPGVKPVFSEDLQSARWLTGILVFRWELSDFRPEKYFWNSSRYLHPDSWLLEVERRAILDWFDFPQENDPMENEKPEIFKRDRGKAAKLKRMLDEEPARVVQETLDRAQETEDKEFSDEE